MAGLDLINMLNPCCSAMESKPVEHNIHVDDARKKHRVIMQPTTILRLRYIKAASVCLTIWLCPVDKAIIDDLTVSKVAESVSP